MTDYQRIELLLKYLGLSARALSIALRLKSPQVFYDIKAEKCGISKELAAKIQECFQDISAAWLLTGEGEMLKTQNTQTTHGCEKNMQTDSRPDALMHALTEITAMRKLLENALTENQRTTDRLLTLLENMHPRQ